MFFSSAVFKLESADTCCERSNKSAQTIVTRAICSIPDKRPTFGLDDDDVGHVVLRRERSYGVYQLGRETPVNELLRHMDATRKELTCSQQAAIATKPASQVLLRCSNCAICAWLFSFSRA